YGVSGIRAVKNSLKGSRWRRHFATDRRVYCRQGDDMTKVKISALAIAALAVCSILGNTNRPKIETTAPNVDKAIHWLVSVQGHDGGWGQDGGETSYVRVGERLESNGNDVANSAVAVLALVHAGNTPVKGEYRSQVRRGVDFILRSVDDSPEDGLAVTRVTGSQIQRKLG